MSAAYLGCRPDHPGRGLFTGAVLSTAIRAAGLVKTVHDPAPGGGIDLTSVPLVPAASLAFTPAELEERIRVYAARAARRLPLFREGRPDPARPGAVVCGACGRPSPNGPRCDKFGWRTRANPRHGCVRETYCPECFAQWGWGDLDLEEAS